jgi:ketosteroid isomerase-like protein
MRMLIAATAALFSVVTSSGVALAGSPQDDVKAAYAAWDAAFNKNDPKAIAAFYATDALLLPANHEVYKGPAAAEGFFKAVLGTGASNHKLEIIDAQDDGQVVFAAAKWTATGKDAQGKDQPWAGLATHVFKRQPDGSLKLVMHSFN